MQIEINKKREILITSIQPNVKIGFLNEELTDAAVREIEKRLKLAEQFIQLIYEVEPPWDMIVSDLKIAANVLPKLKAFFNQYKN